MDKKQVRVHVSSSRLTAPVLLLFVACALFTALGIWQVKRLAWKQDLIARVEQRVDAPPVAVSDDDMTQASELPALEYRRVMLNGRYIASGTALAQAVTVRGAGYWVMTPLKTGDGRIVYINRGYVPTGSKIEAVQAATPRDEVQLIGLIRLTEPKGGFLRSNMPEQDRWYSRDIDALTLRHGLQHVAPFFIDAQSEEPASASLMPASALVPVPGLTVISFSNNHLSYALTWFTMALLSLGAGLWFWRRG